MYCTWVDILCYFPPLNHTQTFSCTQMHVASTHTAHVSKVVTSPNPQSVLSLVLWGHKMLIDSRKPVFRQRLQRTNTILNASPCHFTIIQNTKKPHNHLLCALLCGKELTSGPNLTNIPICRWRGTQIHTVYTWRLANLFLKADKIRL